MGLFRKIVKEFTGSDPLRRQLKKFRLQADIAGDVILHPSVRLDFRIAPEKRKYISIGAKGNINACFIFESTAGSVSIGKNVYIGGAHLISRSSIVIGDDVTMAWGITIYDHNSHSIYWEHRKNDNRRAYEDQIMHGKNAVSKDWKHVESAPVKIDNKTWIGFNVIILKGVTIGEGAVVAAGSVVTSDIPPYTVAGGNPARVIKTIEKSV